MNAQPTLIRTLLLPVALGASVLLNIGLLWRGARACLPTISKPAEVHVQSVAPPTKATKPDTASKPFNWSQVESEDFATYIANLRRIGCPEITIQRLVSAELDSLYADVPATDVSASRQQPGPRSSGPVLVKHDEKRRIMEQLFSSKNADVAPIAGASSSGVTVTDGADVTNAAIPQMSTTGPQAVRSVSLPLVLQETTGKAAALSPAELQQVAAIRDEFVANIGGPHQSPNDPGYLSRWRSAQVIADDQLKAQIGWTAYNQLGIVAAQEAYAKAHPELVQ